MNSLIAASLYQWLMFLHVLAAMIWVGGLVVLIALSGYLLRAGDPKAIAGFSGSLRRIGPLTLAPSTIAVVSLGIGLVLDSDGAWRFSQAWVILALALFAAAFLIGAAFQSRAAIALQRAADAGDGELAARHLRRWSWGMRVILLLLVVITWDMVVKPAL
jgi:uncharacterized membrane protein